MSSLARWRGLLRFVSGLENPSPDEKGVVVGVFPAPTRRELSGTWRGFAA